MAVLGRACLILSLAACAYGIGAALYGARTGRREWAESGRRAVYVLAGLLTVAFAVLELAFLRSDFSFETVATHSSTTTPGFYKAAAVWSSQEGSLLLWAWLVACWSSLVLFLTRKRLRDVAPYATAVLLVFGAFFVSLLVFAASPFHVLSPAPTEGAGLNPLLRHPSMMIHPPMLYSGYTLFTIPFAFAIGALAVRRVDAEWIRSTRRFALAAWFFLGIGILLGARWSYSELGWGGYWAWDPVENASLMPWLTGTAFLHSIIIQEKRGMLKMWNVSLVLATGVLAILGTFLVRSGILDSIHAFGASTLGVPFVAFIALLAAGSIVLVVSRRDLLRAESRLDSLLSREAMFLGNNIVLVGLCFVVFWGTFFPLISEAVTGTKAAIGPPWYDRYTVPLALLLVLLSGIGPVIAWRRATLANARRNFVIPVACGLACAVVPGQTQRVDGYDVKYVRAYGRVADDPDGTGASMTLGAVLTVSKHGHHVATLRPARNYYPGSVADGPVGQYVSGDATSEVGLKAGLRRDFWVAMQPDAGWLQRLVARGNRLPSDAAPIALLAIARAYGKHPPPA